MRNDTNTTDVQRLLLEWARWRANGHGANIGYPTCTTFYRMSKAAGWGTRLPIISDDLACRVDLAVSRLHLRCVNGDYRYDALTDAYLAGQTDSAIARRLNIDRKTVRQARIAAESWVDSHIDLEVWESKVYDL